MSELGKKLKELRIKKGVSQQEVADAIKVSDVTIGRYERGARIPDINTLLELSAFYGVPANTLLTDEQKQTLSRRSSILIPADNLFSSGKKLKIVGTVCAGKGRQAYEEQIGEEYAYIENANPLEHFYLKIKGDSMEPKISAGDLALVHRQNDVDSGDLAIVLVNDEDGVIKKVIKTPNSIELHSFNPYYPTREFKGEEMNSIKIIGKVLKIISSW